jgi:hypothetical protein
MSAFWPQSALTPANLITLAHFSVSSAMNLPKSTGEPAGAMPPKVCQARLQFEIDEAGIDLLIELVDDLGGRVPGNANAIPLAGLVARHELAHGWEVPAASPSASRSLLPARAACQP